MDQVVELFISILVALLIFAILFWLARLTAALFPPPMQAKVQTFLYILLGLFAILFLLGDIGVWGTWGWGGHHRFR